MKDQYGNDIPDDLVFLSCGPDRFNKDELEIIDNAQWYLVQHAWGEDLAVSFAEVRGLIDEPLGDAPVAIKAVNRVLHRYNDEDGFYYA
mgnify:CR=1 FL=1